MSKMFGDQGPAGFRPGWGALADAREGRSGTYPAGQGASPEAAGCGEVQEQEVPGCYRDSTGMRFSELGDVRVIELPGSLFALDCPAVAVRNDVRGDVYFANLTGTENGWNYVPPGSRQYGTIAKIAGLPGE